MRYIIETAALHAKLLNRTLVIPSYILARTCEKEMLGIYPSVMAMDSNKQHNSEVCGVYVTMVARRKAVSDSEWNALPSEERV